MGLRFSLLQLIVSIVLILIIAYFVIRIAGNKSQETQIQDVEQTQQNTLPIQNIQIEGY